MAQTVKSLPAVGEIRLQSLGREDPLEKEMSLKNEDLDGIKEKGGEA